MFADVFAFLDSKTLSQYEICALAAIIEEHGGHWTTVNPAGLPSFTHFVTWQLRLSGILIPDATCAVNPNYFLDSLKVGRRLQEKHYALNLNSAEEHANLGFLDSIVDVFLIDPFYECELEVLLNYKNMILDNGGQILDSRKSMNWHDSVRYVVTDYHDTAVALEARNRGLLCGTMYWILDCIREKRILDPALKLIHSPWPRIVADLGMQGVRVSLSQFDPVETLHYKIMLRHLGAVVDSKLSKECQILICDTKQGNKYLKAMEWGIRVETSAFIKTIWTNALSTAS